MPELPEVETIRKQLSELLPFNIESIERSKVSQSIIKQKSFALTGKSITSIGRKGKALIFNLSSGEKMISHLGMSGGWVVNKQLPHSHLTLCNERVRLHYVDPRRFGKIHLLDSSKAKIYLERIGVDVSTDEFTPKLLHDILQKVKVEIKPFLLEQKKIAGIGNYMASEILALAKVDPQKVGSALSYQECQAIVKATQRVIKGQVKAGGLTFQGGYKDTTGAKGEGLKRLVVFHQELCRLCNKTEVKKIIQKGRATYFCPNCQRL